MASTVPNKGLIRFQGFLESEHLLVTSTESIQQVLVQESYNFVKPKGAKKLFNRFLGSKILFMSEGSDHKESKRHMQPPFSLSRVKTLYGAFWERAVRLCDEIEREVMPDEQGSIVNIEMPTHNATLDAVLRTTFGEKFEGSPHKIEILQLKDTVLSGTWDVRLYFMMAAMLPVWAARLIPGGISARVDEAGSRVRQSVRNLIRDRTTDVGSAASDDIATQIAAAGYFSEDELVANLLSIVIAG